MIGWHKQLGWKSIIRHSLLKYGPELGDYLYKKLLQHLHDYKETESSGVQIPGFPIC